ncbi:unnamed protein product [Ceratitis capitata]|uniref:(Mediterranean fruit fly) hypothetical protein n=1 Tax=Ceratitis capitata TaxID=7213 RepID=A0A811U9N4_CERCA|nr:unnamed protein product [Ceratitis capitata]
MLKELLDNDIICKSESEYASPIRSEGLRVDFRRLNQQMRKEIFPSPNIEEELQRAKSFKYFSVLDLNSGYYQIPIEESSRKYTAFITTEGLYGFKRMPFGLKNAPAVFQRLIVKIKDSVKPNEMTGNYCL